MSMFTKPSPAPPIPPCRANRFDWAAVVLTLLLTAGLFCLPMFLVSDGPGEVCLVTYGDKEIRMPLDTPDTVTFVSRGIQITIVVSDGCVAVTECGCPDQVCVKTGAVSRPSEMIACVPAGVVIRIPSTDTGEVPDYVLG